MPPKIDLSGRRFGRLLVLNENPLRVSRRILWECLCDCGAKSAVFGYSLVSGNTTSCGCYKKTSAAHVANRTHGMSRTATYRIWEGIKKRCLDKKNKSYERYGAAGISICDRWRDFNNFLFDMGERPDGMTIDRINNSLGYEPGNCRWATWTQQQRNRTNNKLLTLNGETKTQSAWARDAGISDQTITKRLQRGWPISRAVTEGVTP